MDTINKNTPTGKRTRYLIKVRGIVNQSWSDWFSGVEIVCDEVENDIPLTTLIGEYSDQAALRGVLTKLWDLNMTIVAVYRVGSAEEDFTNYGGSKNVCE